MTNILFPFRYLAPLSPLAPFLAKGLDEWSLMIILKANFENSSSTVLIFLTLCSEVFRDGKCVPQNPVVKVKEQRFKVTLSEANFLLFLGRLTFS